MGFFDITGDDEADDLAQANERARLAQVGGQQSALAEFGDAFGDSLQFLSPFLTTSVRNQLGLGGNVTEFNRAPLSFRKDLTLEQHEEQGLLPNGIPKAVLDKSLSKEERLALLPSELRQEVLDFEKANAAPLEGRIGTPFDDAFTPRGLGIADFIGNFNPNQRDLSRLNLSTDDELDSRILSDIEIAERPATFPGEDVPLSPLQRASGLIGAEGPDVQARLFEDFQESPGVGFLRDQGIRGINNLAAATGGTGGGNRLKALSAFNQGLALQDFNNQLSQLLNIGNVDLGIASGLSNLRQGLGNNNAQAFTNIGNANANAALNRGNIQAAEGSVSTITGNLNSALGTIGNIAGLGAQIAGGPATAAAAGSFPFQRPGVPNPIPQGGF